MYIAFLYPTGSIYCIFTYNYHKFKPNVGKYTIHGSYGCYSIRNRKNIYIYTFLFETLPFQGTFPERRPRPPFLKIFGPPKATYPSKKNTVHLRVGFSRHMSKASKLALNNKNWMSGSGSNLGTCLNFFLEVPGDLKRPPWPLKIPQFSFVRSPWKTLVS